MESQLHKVLINGLELNYLERGNKEKDHLIFIHGSLEDYRTWSNQLEPFAKFYHIIAYSRRYHFPNTFGEGTHDYSVELHAHDLAQLIKNLELPPVHIIGSSYGAFVGLFCATRYPQLIKSLVLGEPPILPLLENLVDKNSLVTTFSENIWEKSRDAFEKGDLELGVKIFIDGVIGNGTYDHFSLPTRKKLMDNAPVMKIETSSKNYFPNFSCEDLQDLKIPTLLLNGENSPKIFYLIANELKRCISTLHQVIIPKSSHGMHTANPQIYNRIVLEFLAEYSRNK